MLTREQSRPGSGGGGEEFIRGVNSVSGMYTYALHTYKSNVVSAVKKEKCLILPSFLFFLN